MIQVIIKYGRPVLLAVRKAAGSIPIVSWIWGTSTGSNWGTLSNRGWGIPTSATAPANITPPSITGTAVVDQTLTINGGTWSAVPYILRYDIYRDTTLITSIATSSSSINYTLVQADAGNASNIKCVVTATNSAGSASADSTTVAQIFDATWWDFRQTLSITDTTINNAMNTYTITRKSISTTASLGAYPMVGGTATTHSRNLYNPADTDAAKRVAWAGTITHNANGVQGNGTNGIGNTFINQLNEFPTNFTIILYSRTNQVRNDVDFGGIPNFTGGVELVLKWSDNNTYCSLRTPQLSAGNIITNTQGFYVFKRSGNTITIKRNNVTIFSTTNTSNVNFNGNMYILGRNNNGATQSPSSKQYTHFEFMNFATDDAQDTALFNAVVAKETALGRNV